MNIVIDEVCLVCGGNGLIPFTDRPQFSYECGSCDGKGQISKELMVTAVFVPTKYYAGENENEGITLYEDDKKNASKASE